MNVPKLRFKNDDGREFPEREINDLGNLAFKVNLKNRDLEINNVLTNSATQGIISQNDYFDRDIANKNNLNSYYIVEKDDFVYNPRISSNAAVGPIKRNKLVRGVMSPLYTVFRFKKGNLTFFEHFFETTYWHDYMKSISNFGARHDRMNITNESFFALPILLPSHAEQTKIANFLTAIDEKITQLTQKHGLLKQYKKGVMQQIFSQKLRFKDDDGREFPEWETKHLGSLVKVYDGTHMTPDYQNQGIPFYSVEHVTSNNFNETKFISREVYENENKRVKLEKGDILMTRIGDIGTPKYINWDVEASFYVSLALLKQSKKINSLYLSHYIRSDSFQGELHKRTIHVAFPKKINLGEISHCLVSYPCISEQTKIATFLTAIDDKITQTQAQLEAVKQYKKGLLQQMFV